MRAADRAEPDEAAPSYRRPGAAVPEPVGSCPVVEAESGTLRAQRVLATLAFALIGISALAVIALLVLQLLPLPGLTIGLLLVIALFIVLAVRRAREQGTQRSRR